VFSVNALIEYRVEFRAHPGTPWFYGKAADRCPLEIEMLLGRASRAVRGHTSLVTKSKDLDPSRPVAGSDKRTRT